MKHGQQCFCICFPQLLPKEQYSSEDLFFILKHELVHLKRGDVYLKLLFVTANAVHSFSVSSFVTEQPTSVPKLIVRTTAHIRITIPWITHFEGESVDSVNQKLEGDGYAEDDSYKWWKQDGDLIYHVIFFSSAFDNPFTVKSLIAPVPSYISALPSYVLARNF